jgi:hypothetical protein
MKPIFSTVWRFCFPFLIFFRANAYFCISIVVSLSLLLLIPQVKEVMLQTPELTWPWAEGVGWGTMLTHSASFVSFGYFVYLSLLFAVGIAAILCVTPPKLTPLEASGTTGASSGAGAENGTASPTPEQKGSPPAQDDQRGGTGEVATGFAARRKFILRVTFPIASVLALIWHVWFHNRTDREGAFADAVFGAYAVALFAAGVAAVIYLAPAPSIKSRTPIPPLAPLPTWKQWLALFAGLAVAFLLIVCGFPPAITLVCLIVLWLPLAYWVVDRLCRELWMLASRPLGEDAAGSEDAPPEAGTTAAAADGALRQAIDWWLCFTPRRWLWATGATVVGLVLIVVSMAVAPLDKPWPMADYPLTILGFLFLGLAACYLFGRWVKLWVRAERSHRAMGRILAWLLLSFAFGEAIWALAYFPWANWLISYRLYAVWGVLRLVVLIVLVASLFDTLDEETAPPWRIFGLICVVLVALAFRVPNPESLRKPALPDGKPADPADWARHLKARIDAIPKIKDENGKERKGPVVLVAASGGGSRAAIFAGLVLEALSRETFCEISKTKWGDHIVLVSGVSGGSLGSARYISGLGGQKDAKLLEALKESIPLELASRMTKMAGEFLVQQQEELNETKKAYKNPDDRKREELKRKEQTVKAAELTQRFCEWRLACELDPESEKAKNPSADAKEKAQLRDMEWVVRSPIMDSLCTDFMAPVLRGALTPLESRGQALRRFWSGGFGWGKNLDRTGYAAEGGKPSFDPHNYPLAIYNSSDVRRGVRIAVGFPPLPADFLGAGAGAATATDDWRPRYPPACLADLDNERAIYLTDAVALSANFPFGFNAITFDRRSGEDRENLRRGEDLAVKILDGGIVDNTGIDTLFLVLEAIRAEALSTRAGPDPALYREIWEEFLDRRVYLVEIDSGAKPEKPGPATRFVSVLLDPLGSMNNASFTNAARDKHHFFDALGKRLSRPVDLSAALQKLSKDAAKLPPAEMELFRELSDRQTTGVRRFNWVRFDANHFEGENVQTAWSLAPRHKALLLARFLNELAYVKPKLRLLCELARKDEANDRREMLAAANKAVAEALKNRPRARALQSVEKLKSALQSYNQKQQLGESPRQLLTTLDEADRHLKETEARVLEALPSEMLPQPGEMLFMSLQVLAAQTVTSPTMPSLASATTQVLTVKRFQDETVVKRLQDETVVKRLQDEWNQLKRSVGVGRQELEVAEMFGGPTPYVPSFMQGGEFEQALRSMSDQNRAALYKLKKLKTAGPTQIVQEDLSGGAVERRQAFDQPRK